MNRNSPPPISIILLTLNGGQPLAAALAAIFSQQLEAATESEVGSAPSGFAQARETSDSLAFPAPEVIVIDSGSTDGTLEAARRYPVTLHHLAPDEFGHGRTRNLGARLAKGEWLVYLTQDAIPANSSWLFKLTRHLRQPEVAAAFGRQLPPSGLGPIETFFLEQTYPNRAFRHLPSESGQTNIQRIFFSNVNAALKKSVWARHPFPDDVVMSEDQAFARAVLQAGHTIVYDPEAAVYHGHRYTLLQLFRRNFDSGFSLRRIASDRWRDVARMGLRYVWNEVGYLARGAYWRYIPYALLYEAVKSAGFALGRGGHRLPRKLRRRLSLHPRYWSTGHE